jgi:hypothetical protein
VFFVEVLKVFVLETNPLAEKGCVISPNRDEKWYISHVLNCSQVNKSREL